MGCGSLRISKSERGLSKLYLKKEETLLNCALLELGEFLIYIVKIIIDLLIYSPFILKGTFLEPI